MVKHAKMVNIFNGLIQSELTMKTLWIFVAALILITLPLSAQDEPVATGTAPTIVSLSPAEAVLQGVGVVIVEVVYEDADSDAISFDWEMVETDMEVFQIPDGYFNQVIVGETINVPFTCTGSPYSAVIALQVVDYQGNRSDPQTFSLVCEAEIDDPDSPAGDPDAPEGEGSAPTVVSIEPAEMTIPGFSRTIVNVTYEDVDGDASTFIWNMVETDALTWDLSAGVFRQSVVGTTIPVTFFCTTPTFQANIELVVADEAGNQSEPAIFLLTCDF